ncbi:MULTISPECIES: DUF4082 domain-containing protein [unclassified Micromonospora]|uniref:DUF4082 domain-containing protein n=1 Tax=unclassified Micromonospora TaxID=2617518 RepID=UPI0036C8769F|nr:DUF4082 domain-containing protein [Micromonospora sp. NBC_00858]
MVRNSRAVIVLAVAGAVAISGTALAGRYATSPGGAEPAAAPSGTYSLWSSSAVPGTVTDPDRQAVELGVKFTATQDGSVLGVRFYKSRRNTGVHTGSLWAINGTRLATVRFTNESPSGWQYAAFSASVAVKANALYVVSYHTNVGQYSADDRYFAADRSRGPLRAPADGSQGANGVYRYGAGGFPNRGYRATNYWVDVVFNPGAPATSSPTPRPTTASPRPTSPSPTPTAAPTPSSTPPAAPTPSSTPPVPTPTVTGNPDSTGGGRYPQRFSVGAPGVGRYRQSDARLPVPAGYQEVFPHDTGSKEWDLYECNGTVNLDHKYFHAFIYIGTNCHGTVNITNSIIAPPPGSANRAILVNANSSGSLRLNISNTTIRPEPVGLGMKSAPLTDHAINDCNTCTIQLSRVDVANTGGMCLCGANTTIEYSWLHDNYIAHLADPSQAHTGGVFPYGGTGPLEISHSRLEPGVNAYTGAEIPNYWQAITAVLFTQSSGGSRLRNYQVHDSFISLGAFGLYAQEGEGLRLRDNVFGPTHWGYTSRCGSGCYVTFADWTNNVVGTIDGAPTAQLVPRPA